MDLTTTTATSTSAVNTIANTYTTGQIVLDELKNIYKVSNDYFNAFEYPIYFDFKQNMEDKDGYIYVGSRKIMPSVKEIKMLYSNDKAVGVKVTFADDSVEKAICDAEDTFNYDYGLAICIMKRLFSYMFNNKEFTGTYYFNKIMDLAFRNNLKTFNEHIEEDKKKEQEKHRKEKNRLRKERQKRAKKEAEIEIQKEAYLRAMNEFNRGTMKEFKEDK